MCLLLRQVLVWGIFLCLSPVPEMYQEEVVQILQLMDTNKILLCYIYRTG